MTEQENMMSALDIFAASQETFEEAKKKSSDESRKRANYLRFSQDGTYAVRILPLAPVIDKDGKVLPAASGRRNCWIHHKRVWHYNT